MTTPESTAPEEHPGPPFHPHERVRVREGTTVDLSGLTGTVTAATGAVVVVRFVVEQVFPEEMLRSAARWER